jgi:membrane-bound serine protease (ClpP class)
VSEEYLLWGLGLLAAALLLIVVEVFVPSAGLISLVAATVAIGGLVCLFKVGIVWGILGILAMLVLGPTMFFFALNIMPNTPMGKKLLFGEEAGKDDEEPAADPSRAEQASLESLIGSEGRALTDLRPVGTIKVGDKRLDALSEISLIRAGTRVRITSVVGNEVKVRPIE